MASHRRFAFLAFALLASSMLTACARPTIPPPAPSPTYQCIPEAGGAPMPCGPIEYEQAQARDALYAEAEAAYQRYWEESIDAEQQDGNGIPAGIREIIAGKFLTYEEELWTREKRSVRVGGKDPALVRMGRAPGLSRDGSSATLLVCWDASQTRYRSHDGVIRSGVISEQRIYLSRLDSGLKITNAEFREVDGC